VNAAGSLSAIRQRQRRLHVDTQRAAVRQQVASGGVLSFHRRRHEHACFGEAAATTLGRGTGFTAAVSGSGAQIKVAGRASSLTPATIACGAFTRARTGRSSGSVRPDPISGSFSCKLYQTIFFSFGRISWS
jgi:hypothetical protein